MDVQVNQSKIQSTSLITSYIGETTWLRKASSPPPYAGMTISPVVKLTAPVNMPCNSLAI